MLHDISSNPAFRGPLPSSTNHGRGFRCVNGAHRSIHFRCFVAAGLSGCLGTPHVIGMIGGGDFEAAVWPSDATHAVTIVLVPAIGIALDNSDGGNEATIYFYMY